MTAQVRDYLDIGLAGLQAQSAEWDRRENYFRGKQDLPYAPEGVSEEYLELRKQAVVNLLDIAMLAPVQRMRCDGIRSGTTGEVDKDSWDNVWQPNKLDQRQRIVYLQMMVHGRGIWSVSKNPDNPARPKVRVESSRRVWLEPDPENPFETLFAVKTFSVGGRKQTNLWVPAGTATGPLWVAYVYTTREWFRFERQGHGGIGSDWKLENKGEHGLGEVPFIPSDTDLDADGRAHSSLTSLMPQQDALNTIRFNTLLAMQFSAFRQRGVSGFDPVVRDAQGNPVYQRDDNGDIVKDANGQPKPLLQTMGRVGVDRILAFPGADTKIWDLPESNLENYIKVYGDFLTTLFATGQIPPQYMLTRMSNLSGDALAGAESTLQALVADLKTGAGEAIESVVRLSNRARGVEGVDDFSMEVMWGDAEARSFAQVIDAVTKLVSIGFPRQAAFEMIPGATPPKVAGWLKLMAAEAQDPVLEQLTRALGSKPSMSEVDPAADLGVTV